MNSLTTVSHRYFALVRPQWWLALMLLSLHAALAWDIDAWWSRAFLLTHFGVFLLWQPVWQGERSLKLGHAALVALLGFILVFLNSWWLTTIWLCVLFGLIGSNVTGVQHRGQRVISMLAATYLLAMLLVWVVPHLFESQRFSDAILILVRYGLVLLPLLIMLLKVETRTTPSFATVDLLYSLMLFLLVVALVLGSFVVKVVSGEDYPIALAGTLIGIAVLLIGVSWLWNPHSGFSGLSHVLSRYLLSMGLPVERWMQSLAQLAEQESDAQKFLERALEDIGKLPWISGMRWHTSASNGHLGTATKFGAEFSWHDLNLVIYTSSSLSPALLMHLKVLTQLLGYFYTAKQREQYERENAYMQAIYETGARLTHDVKNLLQSLKSLCSAIESSEPSQATRLQSLLQRQLPQITQRLQNTMDKLHAPQLEKVTLVPANEWWGNVQHRYNDSGISFFPKAISCDARIPMELFDSVADNLLQNALNKRKTHDELLITVSFDCDGKVALGVCDDGSAINEAVASNLLKSRVSSRSGLGIGLYHASKQASQLGYQLLIANNENGKVCFELTKHSEEISR